MGARPTAALAGLAAATALTACSSTGSGQAALGSGAPESVGLVVTPTGCAPAPATLPSGPMTFTVRNDGAPAVSEVELLKGSKILAEKENLIPGRTASFSLRLAPGSYTVYCPGAKKEKAAFVVTPAS